MSRRIFPVTPFSFLVNEESEAVPPRAEMRLLNLFPLLDESQSAISLFQVSEQSQNTVNLLAPADQSENTMNLFSVRGRSQNTPNQLPLPGDSQNTVGLFRFNDRSQVSQFPLSGQSQSTLNLLPLSGRSQDTLTLFPLSGQIRNTLTQLPLSGQSQNTLNLLPLTGQSQDTLNLIPLSSQTLNTLNQLTLSGRSQNTLSLFPLSDQTRNALNLFPLSGQTQHTLNVFPLSGQSQDTLNLFPLSGQTQNTLNLFPSRNQSGNTLDLFPFNDQSENTLHLHRRHQLESTRSLSPLRDRSQNTVHLLDREEESWNALDLRLLPGLSLLPPNPESLKALDPRLFLEDHELDVPISSRSLTSAFTGQQSRDPLVSLVGAQVEVVPEDGAGHKAVERGLPTSNFINTQQGGGNDGCESVRNFELVNSIDVHKRRDKSISVTRGALMNSVRPWRGRCVNEGSSSKSRVGPSRLSPRSQHAFTENSSPGSLFSSQNLQTRKEDEIIPTRNPRPPANYGPVKRSSVYTGVTFYKRTGRWEAHIWHKKQIYLGASATEIQAARAYDRAHIHFRGSETEGLNFHKSDYEEEVDQLEAISHADLIKALRKQSAGAGMPMPDYGPPMDTA